MGARPRIGMPGTSGERALVSLFVSRGAAFLIPNSSFLIQHGGLSMKPRKLFILALVVMVIGVYILLVERHRPTSDEVEAQAEKLLQDFDREVGGTTPRRWIEDLLNGGAWVSVSD